MRSILPLLLTTLCAGVQFATACSPSSLASSADGPSVNDAATATDAHGADAATGGDAHAPAADAASDAGAGAEGGPAVDKHAWNTWPMPNPAAANLPEPSSYITTVDVVTDNVTHLEWQRDVPPTSLSWQAAIAACDALVLGGKSDWRLPTRIELLSLFDYTRVAPALDTTAFPHALAHLGAGTVWTASPRHPNYPPGNLAYTVDFDSMCSTGSECVLHLDRSIDPGDSTNQAKVRCVRGGLQ